MKQLVNLKGEAFLSVSKGYTMRISAIILLLLSIVSFHLSGQLQNKQLPVLKFYAKNLKGYKVHLRAMLPSGSPIVDSAVVKTDNDTLTLIGSAKHDEEIWYQFNINRKYTFNPVLDKDKITELYFDAKEGITADFSESDHYRNAPSSVDFNNLLFHTASWSRKKYQLQQSMSHAEPTHKIALQKSIDSLTSLIAGYYEEVLSKTSSVATVGRGLQWLQIQETGNAYTELLKSLSERFPESKRVKEYINWFNRTKFNKNEIKSVYLKNDTIAPEFSFSQINGTKEQLKDYRGKYVLLDFWASWCRPCRQEAPFLKNAYSKFKDNKFVIIQVSIDKPQDEAKWRKAIADDNVGEFIHTNLYPNDVVYKKYNVVSLPTNYLISPEGKIISSNLRGERLNAELERIFKR